MEPNFRRRTIPRLRPGDPVSADWLNSIVDALNDAQSLRTLAPRGGEDGVSLEEEADGDFPFKISADLKNQDGLWSCSLRVAGGDVLDFLGVRAGLTARTMEVADVAAQAGEGPLWCGIYADYVANVRSHWNEWQDSPILFRDFDRLEPADQPYWGLEFLDDEQKRKLVDDQLGKGFPFVRMTVPVFVVVGRIDFALNGGNAEVRIEQRLSSDYRMIPGVYNADVPEE